MARRPVVEESGSEEQEAHCEEGVWEELVEANREPACSKGAYRERAPQAGGRVREPPGEVCSGLKIPLLCTHSQSCPKEGSRKRGISRDKCGGWETLESAGK